MEDTPILYYRSEFQDCPHKMDQPVRRRQQAPQSLATPTANITSAQHGGDLTENDPNTDMEHAQFIHGHPGYAATPARTMANDLDRFGDDHERMYEQLNSSSPNASTYNHSATAAFTYAANGYNPYSAAPSQFNTLLQGPVIGAAQYMPSVHATMNLYQGLPVARDDGYPSDEYASDAHAGIDDSDFTDAYLQPHASSSMPTFDSHHFPTTKTEDDFTDPALGNYEDETYEPAQDAPVQAPTKRKIAKPRSRRAQIPSPPSSSHGSPPPNVVLPPQSAPAAGLRFNGFAEAEAAAYNRARLSIKNDDWEYIRDHPAAYVRKLVDAFYANAYGAANPEGQQLTGLDKKQWTKFQTDHAERMAKFDYDQIEAACWVLLKTIIEAHEIGVKRLRYHRSEGISTCSAHVDKIAGALRDYTIFRYDVVRLQRLDELTSSTSSAICRKVSNFKGNWGKTLREIENDKNAKAAGIDYKPVLGDNKGKRRVAAAALDEDGEELIKPPTKKTKTTETKEIKPKASGSNGRGRGRKKVVVAAADDDYE